MWDFKVIDLYCLNGGWNRSVFGLNKFYYIKVTD
jgi:hypothetical protein